VRKLAFWKRKRVKAKDEPVKAIVINVTDWEAKYREEHEAFVQYRNEVASQETKRRKEEAYAALLGECGIGEKYRGRLVGLCDLDSVSFDEEGRICDREVLLQRISDEWGDLIAPSSVPVASPPMYRGQVMTKESIMAIRDRDARRAAILENMELFS
jgi:hypothetical protein